MKTATLLITCRDCRGIVAGMAQVLAARGLNILDSDQHTDPLAGIFFQRIRFDLAGLVGDRAGLEAAIAAVAEPLRMDWRIAYAEVRPKVALFVGKQDHCLHDLLQRHQAGELAGEIVLVVSNHPDARAVAAFYGVDFHVFPITGDNKRAQEQAELALLAERRVELVVLARYMQVLSGGFLAAFPGAVINIHHSFLPAFMGGNPYRQAFERGVKVIGATAHYVTEDLDEGPIIEQDVLRASHRDTVEDLVRKGRDVERVVLSRAVRWHLENRVLRYGNKTVVFA
ncbi:MAG TPA: formyltetrahydrofolate deformylase [Planctomycetota bacterium]